LVTQVVTEAGQLDVLINNAGIFLPHPPLEVDAAEWLEKWNEILTVNLLSPAALCHAAANAMAEQGGGRIINIGSRGAFRGEPDCPAYGASKAGLHSMSQSLALALAPKGVLVYAVAPGWVETRPEEVAETVCFLASSEAEFLTGSIIDVNGASYLRQ
jgi:NAD(P)-dependent dehydrogenase (short-subunit alcohol dehydrogenase family)